MQRSHLLHLMVLELCLWGCLGTATALGGQTADLNTALYRTMMRYLEAREYPAALDAARSLILQTTEHERVYFRVMQIARGLGRLDAAKELFESLIPTHPRAYYGLGLYYAERGNDAQAVECYQKALEAFPEDQFPLMTLLGALRRLGRMTDAEAYVRGRLAANPQSAAAHFGLGYFHVLNRRPDAADSAFEQAQKLNPRLAEACYYRALAYGQAERYREEQAVLQRCYPPLQAAGLTEEMRQTFHIQLGGVWAALGDYPTALKHFEEAVRLAEGMHDGSGAELALGVLGQLHLRHDNHPQAIQALRRALSLAQRDRRTLNVANHLRNLADIQWALGDWQAAAAVYEDAYAQAQTLDVRLSILHNLGSLFTAQDDQPRATEYFNQLLALEAKNQPRRPRVIVYEAQAFLKLAQGDWTESFVAFKSAATLARESGDLEPELRNLNHLGEVAGRQRNWLAAVAYFEQARTLAASANSLHQGWRAEHGLAQACEAQGNWEAAAQHYRSAIELIERLRNRLVTQPDTSFFYHDKLESYRRYLGVVMRLKTAAAQLGDHATAARLTREAFQLSERTRARALVESLNSTGWQLEQKLPPELQAQRGALQTQFAQLETQLKRATAAPQPPPIAELRQLAQAWQEWRQSVRKLAPHVASLRFPEPLSVEEVQQLLKLP